MYLFYIKNKIDGTEVHCFYIPKIVITFQQKPIFTFDHDNFKVGKSHRLKL